MTISPTRAPETNGLAIGAFILSLLGLSLLGLVLGIVSLRQCRAEGQRGDGFSLAAIWIGGIGTAIWSFFVLSLVVATSM